MLLRNRLYLGVMPILLILISFGMYAVYLINSLSDRFHEVQGWNSQSIFAAQRMLYSASRLETATYMSSQGMRTAGRDALDRSKQDFERKFALQRESISEPGEEELTDELAIAFERYLVTSELLVEWSREEAVPVRLAALQVEQLNEVVRILDAIGGLNQQAILDAEQRFNQVVKWSVQLMVVGMIAAVIGALVFVVRMSRKIVLPIEELTESTKQLSQGKLNQVVKVESKDEIGELAKAFNKMTHQLKVYQRLMDQRLLQTQRTMRIVLNHFPDPLFFANADHQVTYRNSMARELLNAAEWQQLLPKSLDALLGRTLTSGKSVKMSKLEEAMIMRVNGEERFYLPQIMVIEEAGEAVNRAAVILRDVTRLRLADDLKNDLVATVSHELKTPLTSARMALYLLLEEAVGQLNTEQQELINTARQETDRLLRIIQTLLDFSKIREGIAVLNRTRSTAERMLHLAYEEHLDLAQLHGVQLRVVDASDGVQLDVDENRIGIALANFIVNGIKYSQGGETVLIGARLEEGGVVFYVRDQGDGIAADVLPHLFKRFYRVPGQPQRGAGLGLSIAREIIISHEGRVGAASEVGKGSEFYFWLPMVKV